VELVLQHRVGAQGIAELQQGDVADDAGQVDGGFHAGVAAAHHGHVLALEQGAIAVGAVGHALAPVFLLPGHVQLAPAGAGGQDQGLGLEHGAVGQTNLVETARLAGDQRLRLLQVHDVHPVLLDVFFQCTAQLGSVGVGHGDEVLDGQGVHDLAAEALAQDAGTDALPRRVHRRRRAGRSAAHHQHVEGRLLSQFGCVTRGGPGIEPGDDLLDAHAAVGEGLAVQVDAGHGHDLARVHLVLEQGAVDHHVMDVRVDGRHGVQGLHHVRAVVAGQGDVGLETEVAGDAANLLDHVGFQLGRVAAGLEQGQDQGGELVAHGQAGEADAGAFFTLAHLADGEGGAAGVVAIFE
jgi:hypothetical protein